MVYTRGGHKGGCAVRRRGRYNKLGSAKGPTRLENTGAGFTKGATRPVSGGGLWGLQNYRRRYVLGAFKVSNVYCIAGGVYLLRERVHFGSRKETEVCNAACDGSYSCGCYYLYGQSR